MKNNQDGVSVSMYDQIPIPVRSTPIAWRHSFRIDGEFADTWQFDTAIETLNNASENDLVEIHLSSYGGSLNSVESLIHAIRKTAAHVHIIATGEQASAATLLMMEAHSFELSDNFSALLHNGSYSISGNSNEIKYQSNFHINYMEQVMRKAYKHFLSDYEIDEMNKGVDIMLTADEWCDRFQKRIEAIEKEIEDALKKEEAAKKAPVKKPVAKKETIKK